jgi:ABC-type nitrate/sulfonate/bicarbonate transport system substrate-binding protein
MSMFISRWRSMRAWGTVLISVLTLFVVGCAQTAAPQPTSPPAKAPAPAPAAPAAPAASPAAAPAAKPAASPAAAAPAALAASPAAAPAAAPAASPAAAPAAAPSGGGTRVVVGLAIEDTSYAPVSIAVAAKFFEEQGLNVERTLLQGDAGVITAITSGDIQFGAHTTTSHLNFINRGGQNTAVYGLMNKMSLDMVVSNTFLERKGVTPADPYDTRLKSLLGGRFATVSLGGASEKITRYMIKLAGGNPQSDAEIVQLGSLPQILNGIKGGTADGFTLTVPIGPQVEADGYGKTLIRGSEIPETKGYHFAVLAGRSDYVKQNPDVIRRMNIALTKASEMIARDPERATDLLRTSYFPNVARDVMQKSVVSLADGVQQGGRMSPDGWDKVVTVEQTFTPDLKLSGQAGQGTWWTNEYLP